MNPSRRVFQRIPPLIVDEVHAHMKEMLEVGTIHPSQSPWCNAVVLLHKKDGGLHFCIDFCKLNARTKKDSYECECMPCGLCNAPATFQMLMQNCLGELNLTYCLIYLADVIVFSRTVEEHLKCLHIVFDHFGEHNLRLNPTKCEIFWDEINIWPTMSLRRVCGPAKRI